MNKPQLGAMYINPSGGCNLHCSHCWVNEGTFDGSLLPLNSWKELLRQASELNCIYIKLTGGEPLLYPEITELYSFAAETFPRVSIETNGTIQPPGIWEAFKAQKPALVSVSIDSADPGIHDSFRGKAGSWHKSIEFVNKLVEYGVESQMIMSISDTKHEPVKAMVDLVERTGVQTLKINLITPSGRGKDNNFTLNTSVKETLQFFEWISRETPGWVLPSIPAAFVPVSRLKNIGYCPVRHLMGVLPDGTFSLCGVAFSRSEMAWGKFPEVSVRDAWNRSPVYSSIRTCLPEQLQGVCRTCIHRDTCLGCCVVNNLETGGSICSPDSVCQKAFDAGMFPETRMTGK